MFPLYGRCVLKQNDQKNPYIKDSGQAVLGLLGLRFS